MAAGAARKKTTWLYKNVMNKNLETQEDINYVEHRVPCPKYPTEKYNLFHFKSFKRTCTAVPLGACLLHLFRSSHAKVIS